MSRIRSVLGLTGPKLWTRLLIAIFFTAIIISIWLVSLQGLKRTPLYLITVNFIFSALISILLITLLGYYFLLKSSRRAEEAVKKSESALMAVNESLELRVSERTTELVEASQKLQFERQRLFDVLEALPAYVLLLSEDYHVPFANRFFEERFGKSDGRRCYEYLLNRTEPCEHCGTLEALQFKKQVNWHWTGSDKRDYDAYAFPFTDSDGTALVMEMGIDVTERNQAEKALRERSMQLRALASELSRAEQREQKRLAEILHDDLQQLLVGAKLRLHPLNKCDDPSIKEQVEMVQELIDKSIAFSRTLTSELSPAVLHQQGLTPALEWLSDWMKQKYNFIVEVKTDGSAAESEDTNVLLFRSIRELLFNAVKHAKVNSASVNIARVNENLRVVIADAGVGFEPGSLPNIVKGGAFGLVSIRERLGLAGGTMAIESAPSKGTRFTIEVPVACERE